MPFFGMKARLGGAHAGFSIAEWPQMSNKRTNQGEGSHTQYRRLDITRFSPKPQPIPNAA
jgi:hypothetical protein